MTMTLEENNMSPSLTIPNDSIVSRAVTAVAANIKRTSTCGNRDSKHYSVSVFYNIATEQDNEINDELAAAQRILRDIKLNISRQSKNNFLLERDVRFLDSRIALLIQNRMGQDEQNEIASHLEDSDESKNNEACLDERKLQQYGNLFFLLQSEPHYIASLCRLVKISEIDTLLQTVMFTLYGNQYESREENLLLTMFQNVLATQFDSTDDFGSLLRANTPVSRMLTTYTRRGPGQSYLKSVLSSKINQLIERKDLNLQINPLKVYDEIVMQMELEDTLPPGFNKSVTPDVASSNITVQSLIQPRLEQLIGIADMFLTTIIDSLHQVPYGIRWVCKQIRSFTKRKYPDTADSAISSLIGGFFFLRFINPAIVTPQAYMLIDDFPGVNPRIILTLIAKMLQNLANKPTYAKESYMIPTNPFVKNNKQRINKFLNDLCDVSDFNESLEMDQYMALSRRDIHINITPNELYNTQSLLQKHLDELAPDFTATNHLRILLNDLGSAPKQLPRKLNRPIQLSLFGRWDTSTILLSSEKSTLDHNLTQTDILYLEAKSTFVQIIRYLPTPIESWHLLSILQVAGSTNDTHILGKCIKAQTMLEDLEEAGVVTRQDNYASLVEEIKSEMNQLDHLKKRVILEINSLQKVNTTIEDHTQYLQSQLDSYKAYLQNVRMQSNRQKEHKKFAGKMRSSSSMDLNVATLASIPHSQQPNKSIFNIYGCNSRATHASPPTPTHNTAPLGKKDKKSSGSINSHSSGSTHTTNSSSNSSGSFRFTYHQLEKEGVIVQSEVPDFRRANIYLLVQSPTPGTFIISLHYKGREKPILEIDLKIDDLLEKQKEHVQALDLEYIKLSVNKVLQLLNRSFKAKSTR